MAKKKNKLIPNKNNSTPLKTSSPRIIKKDSLIQNQLKKNPEKVAQLHRKKTETVKYLLSQFSTKELKIGSKKNP